MTDQSSDSERLMALVGAGYGGTRQWLARLNMSGLMV